MSPTPSDRPDLAPAEVIARAFDALGIDPGHSPAAEAEAAAWRERPGFDDPALDDLLALPFVTIDNPDSRDLDQALYIDREGGDYRVRYALADAAYYVPPGSAVFAAALERGTSHYTPGTVAPMLPRTLSEDLVSLVAGETRRALVFDLRLDRRGHVLGVRVSRALIRSRAKLSYRGVQAFLDGVPRADEPIEEIWAPTLERLRDIGTELAARARERGVIPFDRREAHVIVAGSPPRFVARARARLAVEEWNAQISLLCNREGATLLAGFAGDGTDDGSDAPEGVYRVHDAPLSARLRELRTRLDDWATRLALDPVWRWRKEQTLADYLDALPDTPRDVERVRAVQRQVLIRQRASEFRAEPGRHHALAVDGYARFSSPMREVVGIYTHEELLQTLEGRAEPNEPLRQAVIRSANAAKRRQNALDKAIGLAVITDLLEADLAAAQPPSRAGTVLGIREASARRGGHLYVGLDGPALDLKVYAEDLERRHGTPYTFEALRAEPDDPSRPAFHLGDAVTLRAAGHDAARERFMLDAVPKGEAARRERRRARPS